MSLQTRLTDFVTAVGTDYKQLRTWISGSATGDLTGLTTTTKAAQERRDPLLLDPGVVVVLATL